MAYTSDLRIKNYIKEVDRKIRRRLRKNQLDKRLFLRIFDESKEDSKLWEEGGLSFKDPTTGVKLGSNDAGWAIDKTEPLVIVEGTCGTERGQFGDGQLNRVSHSLGVAINGYLGVMIVPFHGQSFIKKGTKKDILSKKINYSIAALHKGLVAVALNVSTQFKGKFLIIDLYEKNTLEMLVYYAVLKRFHLPNELDKIVDSVIAKMTTYLKDYQFGAKSRQAIETLYGLKNNILAKNVRYYTQNLAALTTSAKRDGHGLLGKNLIELYASKNIRYSIFIRLTKKDIDFLKRRSSKETTFLFKNPRIKVKCFDDLIFEDLKLQDKVQKMRDKNLHLNTEKKLMQDIQIAFNEGKIKIKE